MLAYYLSLARRSFRRNVGLTALMVIAIGFGVGASMTTLTVLHVLSADPIPGKSHRLFEVQLDPGTLEGYVPGDEPPAQVTRADAEALVRAGKADRQALMTGGTASIEPDRPDLKPFYADTRWASADFFAMFDAPFVAGTGWTAADDASAARVCVIASALANKLFGTIDAVGKTIRVGGAPLRVVGVLADWDIHPRFYDVNVGPYADNEQLYAPFATAQDLHLAHNGSMDCWDEAVDNSVVGAPCVWLQLWVELDRDDEVAGYKDFLVHYSDDRRAAGVYQRPTNVRLRDVIDWLDNRKVVPSDARLQMWIALGFLVVCLVNTVGLLFTKFLRRSAEIGVRRALGASRRAIFTQLFVEAGAIGLAGGGVGLGLAYLGLWAVREQPEEYARLASLDLPMLAATFLLAIVASLLAGVVPAWRGCQVAPAAQLKSH